MSYTLFVIKVSQHSYKLDIIDRSQKVMKINGNMNYSLAYELFMMSFARIIQIANKKSPQCHMNNLFDFYVELHELVCDKTIVQLAQLTAVIKNHMLICISIIETSKKFKIFGIVFDSLCRFVVLLIFRFFRINIT